MLLFIKLNVNWSFWFTFRRYVGNWKNTITAVCILNNILMSNSIIHKKHFPHGIFGGGAISNFSSVLFWENCSRDAIWRKIGWRRLLNKILTEVPLEENFGGGAWRKFWWRHFLKKILVQALSEENFGGGATWRKVWWKRLLYEETRRNFSSLKIFYVTIYDIFACMLINILFRYKLSITILQYRCANIPSHTGTARYMPGIV